MQICIDATPLLLRSAGVKNYVHHWISALQRVAGPHRISTFPFFAEFGALDHEKSEVSLARTVAGLALLHGANFAPLPLLNAAGRRFDIFHSSHQLQRPPTNVAVTATIYDMTCWLMPEMHSAANVRAARRFGESVMRRARGLISISEHSKRDAVEMLGLHPDRIAVIYPGLPEAFFTTSAADACGVREKHGLSRPYVLFVGTVEPRKNLAALLSAWDSVAGALREEFELVIAGPAGWAESSLLARLQSPPPGVRYLGYVPEQDLPALTAGAELFVYPSLYEGFGFPPAQAMAAGVAVVTSNVSSLPEVTHGGALLVDPRSPDEIRRALERALESPSLRARLGEAGRARAAAYRWESCARQTMEFFERAAD